MQQQRQTEYMSKPELEKIIREKRVDGKSSKELDFI
jgi:hypothetical protein